MNYTILLYGATGYSGRMIAGELTDEMRKSDDGVRLILAGRNGRALADLAHGLGVDYRTFQLTTRDEVAAKLVDVDLVINAAGPFALTATRLAKAALAADCHYLDINGEFGVYQQMDDLGLSAAARKRVLLCSAGHTSAASSLLLNAALKSLADESRELGAIRLAMSRLLSLSRGSVETMWSSIREAGDPSFDVAGCRTGAGRPWASKSSGTSRSGKSSGPSSSKTPIGRTAMP